jgi:DNA repair photolyase
MSLDLLPSEPSASALVQLPQGARPRIFEPTGLRVTPQVEWVEIKVKTVINRVQGMSFKWSVNPYRGCAHNCPFCFARKTHWYLDQDGVNEWSSRVYVKVNAPELIRRELSHRSWRRESVSLGTSTDPYQPAEGAYRITRGVLEALLDFKTPMTILTRSPMIVRDRDVFADLARGPGAFAYFSITTVDPELAHEIEPDVPPPARRLESMRALADAGVPVGVMLAPVLPGITDDEDHLAAVIEAARDHGARTLNPIMLHLGEVTRDAYFSFLERRRPHLVKEYEKLYRGKYAPRAFQDRLDEVVTSLKRRLNFESRGPRPDRGNNRSTGAGTDADPIEQQQLF